MRAVLARSTDERPPAITKEASAPSTTLNTRRLLWPLDVEDERNSRNNRDPVQRIIRARLGGRQGEHRVPSRNRDILGGSARYRRRVRFPHDGGAEAGNGARR